jgi:hypothetical protein
MKVKVNYDPQSGLVKGYYPDNINYTAYPEPYIVIDAEDQDNTGSQMIIEDGVYKKKIHTLFELKQSIINQIKTEAGNRIIAAYPEWKQRNHMAAVVDIQNKELIALKANTTYTLSADELAIVAAAQAAKTEIFNIRAKSDELEASLDTMTQEQLEAFDATNDSNWV